jgi:hypothetical protein
MLERIALAKDDDLPNLPGFSAHEKRKDPRYKWYLKHYGERCWELDAMPPNLLRDKVESYIRALIDEEAWATLRTGRES